jgi:hypothetical protein
MPKQTDFQLAHQHWLCRLLSTMMIPTTEPLRGKLWLWAAFAMISMDAQYRC